MDFTKVVTERYSCKKYSDRPVADNVLEEILQAGRVAPTIVATHLMLAAYNAGVDSCWLNFFDPAALKAKLNLPENEEILMLLDLGYAAEGSGPLPNHMSRKDLAETVKYL